MSNKIYCTMCKEDKDLTLFPPSRRSLIRSQCSSCTSKRDKENHNPIRQKANQLKHRYNITLDELSSMAIKQCFKCAICSKQHPKTIMHSGLCVDHCHKTGKVRGLLCHRCNLLIGKAHDDIELLQNAIKYLIE